LQAELGAATNQATQDAERQAKQARGRAARQIGLGLIGSLGGGLFGGRSQGAAIAAQALQQGAQAVGTQREAASARADTEAAQAAMLRSQRLNELARAKQCSWTGQAQPQD
jgi:hypothetical protein